MSGRVGDDIELICFDLDDTLWEIWPVIERAERVLHDWLEQHYPRIPERFSPLELRELCARIEAAEPQLALDRSLLRKRALEYAGRETGYPALRSDEAFEVFYLARNEVQFFEEAMPVLERLSKRYRLAALSNGNADIRRVGLGDLMEFALNPVLVGSAKPAPEMFLEASRVAGILPARILHVGDDPVFDVMGAAAAGLRTVWLNRDGRAWPGGPVADAVISTLAGLESWLEQGHVDDSEVGDER